MSNLTTSTDDLRFAFKDQAAATKALRIFLERSIAAVESGVIKDSVDVGMACRLLRDLLVAYSQFPEDAKEGFNEGMAGDYTPDEEFREALHVPCWAAGLELLHPSDLLGQMLLGQKPLVRLSLWIVCEIKNGVVVEVNPNPWRLEEAREYCQTASRNGKQVAMTRLDTALDLLGKPLPKRLSLKAFGLAGPVDDVPQAEGTDAAGKFHVMVVNGGDSFYVTDTPEPLIEALEIIKLIPRRVLFMLLPG